MFFTAKVLPREGADAKTDVNITIPASTANFRANPRLIPLPFRVK